jgi:hypothetical protein
MLALSKEPNNVGASLQSPLLKMRRGIVHEPVCFIPTGVQILCFCALARAWHSRSPVIPWIRESSFLDSHVSFSYQTLEAHNGCEMLRVPHCLDNELIDGSEVVSLTHRPCN